MPRHPFCTDCLAMSPFVSVLLCSFFIRLISSTFIHPYFVLIEALIVGLAILASLISGGFLICFPTTTVLCRSFRIWFQSHSYQHRYCYSTFIGLTHSGDTHSSLIATHYVPIILLIQCLIQCLSLQSLYRRDQGWAWGHSSWSMPWLQRQGYPPLSSTCYFWYYQIIYQGWI